VEKSIPPNTAVPSDWRLTPGGRDVRRSAGCRPQAVAAATNWLAQRAMPKMLS
jgi:hypothetical protein